MRYLFWTVIASFLMASYCLDIDSEWKAAQAVVAHELPDFLRVSATDFSLIKKSRKATIKIHSVYEEGTHVGSGTLFRYEGETIIITAAHVIFPEPDEIKISLGGVPLEARVVYLDVEEDLAVLLVTSKMKLEAFCLRTVKEQYLKIGTKVIYSGYPNNESLMTIQGYVSGRVPNGNLYLHSYGWPGASGSVVLDERGRVIGVLSAVSIGQGLFGMPSVIEDSVIVVPIWKLDLDILKEGLK